MRILRLCLLAVLCVAVLGCSRSSKPQNPPAAQQTPAPTASSAPAPTQTAAAPAPGQASKPETPAQPPSPPKPKPPPVKSDTSVQSLLSVTHGSLFFPEDFKIGGLAGDTLTTDQSAAAATARSFLGGLTHGKVAKELVAPSSAVSDTLTYYLGTGAVPDAFRLGKPKPPQPGGSDSDQIAFNVRLFKEQGSTEGEIYLSKVSSAWLVSDMQISMAELQESREKSSEKFVPGSYRWLLGE